MPYTPGFLQGYQNMSASIIGLLTLCLYDFFVEKGNNPYFRLPA